MRRSTTPAAGGPASSDLLDLPLTTLAGEPTTLGALAAGRVTLVVDVASRCGLTPQYAQLEALQQEYADRGFTVLGVPCTITAALPR